MTLRRRGRVSGFAAQVAPDLPEDVRDDTRVIVTFLETNHIDLRERGIDEAQAAELRAQLGTFAEEWNSQDMTLYDDYDAAKAKL